MKIQTAASLCLAFVLFFHGQKFAAADIANIVVEADAETTLEGFADELDSSSALADTFALDIVGAGNGATSNSSSDTAMDYDWNGATLSGTALITHDKSVNAKAGGDHTGLGNLCFSFTVDTDTNFILEGTFGYVGALNGDDLLEWRLESTDSGTFSQSGSSPTTTSSVNEASFSESGILVAGDYKFTMTADFRETINNADTRQAGWTLNEFTLTPVSVPEPTCASILLFSMLFLARRRCTENRRS